MRNGRTLLGLLVALALTGFVWFGQGDDAARDPGGAPAAGSSASASPSTGTDPESGLPWVAEADLPPEAWHTLDLIDAGGPYPYPQDDEVFGNREGILPDRPRGWYREYTVETPGSDDRGARRIVTGSSQEYYWTVDHYASFSRIDRGSGS